MKKLLALTIALIMLAIVGCNIYTNQTNGTEQTNDTNQEPNMELIMGRNDLLPDDLDDLFSEPDVIEVTYYELIALRELVRSTSNNDDFREQYDFDVHGLNWIQRDQAIAFINIVDSLPLLYMPEANLVSFSFYARLGISSVLLCFGSSVGNQNSMRFAFFLDVEAQIEHEISRNVNNGVYDFVEKYQNNRGELHDISQDSIDSVRVYELYFENILPNRAAYWMIVDGIVVSVNIINDSVESMRDMTFDDVFGGMRISNMAEIEESLAARR